LQLKPHFLFNTLNAVSELVHTDPARAEQVVVKLSDLLRSTLKSFDRNLIPFSEELELLKTYVSLEEVRFAGRLACTFDVEQNTLETRVPCMMLQPIVENSIRHGIGRRRGSGKIAVRARVVDKMLAIEVCDDGPGLPPAFSESGSAGIGIRNTRERLQQLFPGTSTLSIVNHPAGGVAVTIKVPLGESQQLEGTNKDEHTQSCDNRRRTSGATAIAPAGERTV
jgi:LytS/YehU family sensor histidine kinase